MTTTLLALAWLAGITCAAWSAPGGVWTAAALAAGTALLSRGRGPAPALCLAAASAGVAVLAVTRWDAATAPPSAASVGRLVDAGPVVLYGVLTEDGEERGRSQRLQVAVDEADSGAGPRPAEGGVLVRVPAGRPFRAGDLVELYGHLRAPPQLDHFDYRAYLARRGIDAQMDYPRLRLAGHDAPSGLGGWLRSARRAAGRALDRSLPQPEAALARGIILGDRAAIPASVTDDFNRSGTSHLIAISGFNITLVAALAVGALTWLIGRRPAVMAAAAGITVYALFVGLSPSVARALIMGLLLIGGSLLGRPGAPLVALLLAAAAMTVQDPRVVDDVGFQLSFTATAGVMVLAPPIESVGRARIAALLGTGQEAAAVGAVWQGAAVTLAATLATFPVILHAFGRLALAGLAANLLLVPLFPVVMVTSGVAALGGVVLPAAAPVTGAVAWVPLALTVRVAHLAAGLPGASLTLGHPNGAAVLVLYGLGAAVAVVLLRRRPAGTADDGVALPLIRLQPALVLALGAPAMVAGLSLATIVTAGGPDGRLTVWYADAGGATVALVSGPSGERVLVDTGPSGPALARAVDPLLPATDRHVATVLVTRTNPTAVGGFAEAVERYRPAVVAIPADADGRAIPSDGVRVVTLEPGSVLPLTRGARLEFDAVPGDRGRLAAIAVWGARRIALTTGAEGDAAPARQPAGPPGAVAITTAAAPWLSYELRRQGPVMVSTDGKALRIRPARGELLPSNRTAAVSGSR